MNKARRHSFNEGDGQKLKTLNVLYPNTLVKQHQLDKKREHERKKMERLALQLRKKNTILSSCQKQPEANFRLCQRQLILHNHEIKIQSLSSRHSSYEGIKSIFQRKQFVESKYKIDKLIQYIYIINSYLIYNNIEKYKYFSKMNSNKPLVEFRKRKSMQYLQFKTQFSYKQID